MSLLDCQQARTYWNLKPSKITTKRTELPQWKNLGYIAQVKSLYTPVNNGKIAHCIIHIYTFLWLKAANMIQQSTLTVIITRISKNPLQFHKKNVNQANSTTGVLTIHPISLVTHNFIYLMPQNVCAPPVFHWWDFLRIAFHALCACFPRKILISFSQWLISKKNNINIFF